MFRKSSTRILLFWAVLACSAFPATAQVKMGGNPVSIDSSAMLELESTSQGFLPPRMSEAQMAAIVAPTAGLTVYCGSCAPPCLYFFNGTVWTSLCGGSSVTPGAAFTAGSLACTGPVTGTYQPGTAMNASNTKTVSANVRTAGPYTAQTDSVNAVRFTASGTFSSTGAQTITLTAAGTPTAAGTFTYTVALGNQTCTFPVTYTSPGRMVTTFAGSGTAGYLDDTGTAAQFYNPRGLATDRSGNVYVADQQNNMIRKISPAREVTTLAGTGANGFADGPAATAQFSAPYAVAADTLGNVYVGDVGGVRVRKITAAGTVSTVAGNGTQGYVDGTGTAAQFMNPTGVAVDKGGTVIYVADQNNQRIRKIVVATGAVTTFAGSGAQGTANGTGTNAQFKYPTGLALDDSGNVYVADQLNHLIRKITPAGVVSTLAGNGFAGYADGTGSSAQFNYPIHLTVDGQGTVYVGDYLNDKVRKITPAGVVTTHAGSTNGFANGPASTAKFNNPYGVAVDAAGNVYVADQANHRIRKISP